MNNSVKSLILSSVVSALLLGTTLSVNAEESRGSYPQMMQGWQGGGYGPGSQQQGNYGPGMMGGGYGPGMMGGAGYGPGMMNGWGPGMGSLSQIDLTDAQSAQVEKIQTETQKKQRVLMRQMWEEQDKLADLYDDDKRDPAAIGKVYSKVSDLQRQAMEMHVEAENKINALLTKEQKSQLRRSYRRGMMGY